MIEIAANPKFKANKKPKHKINAANGWYRLESRFALPVFGENGEIERYNIFHAYLITKTQCEVKMDTARIIKELRESTGMSRKEFSEHTGIPVRTLEDWEAARRKPPEYIPRLIAYQLKYEELVKNSEIKTDCNSDFVIQKFDAKE